MVLPDYSEKQSIIRPKVDPDALGEVDPSLYPEAKDATNKIRGKHDIIEYLLGDVDHELLIVKVFYFFFYSAFGSLFPLMGVYFKQMGMTPGQCGLLVGCRPFVEFLSAPFWGSYADRWKKGKTLLLVSLSCWIIFTLPIAYLQPPPSRCLRQNDSYYVLELPHKNTYGHSKTLDQGEIDEPKVNVTKIPGIGKSPFVVTSSSLSDIVSPLFSSIVYEVQDIQKSFFLMLLLVLIGEFFSAPAITLVDSAVITLLGDDADRYGHQRMFGSLGWGVAMFFLGIALDHSTEFSNHPCGTPQKYEKNYKICFYAFSALMGCALVTATQIHFRYNDDGKEDDKLQKNDSIRDDYDDALEQEVAQQLNLPSLASSSGIRRRASSLPSKQNRIPDVGKTQMFAQTTREIPEWITVLKHFANLKCSAFLFVAWFMGFGIGLIFTFLFWHLQEYGGTPTLFGFASVINHISEIFAYFFSFRLIQQMGHVKVLCLGLAGNVIRFLYVSWLTDPWLVLPFELMQGITHAAVWAACCSYIAHNTPQELRSSAQGVLQGIHHGLGRGCGAVIGGMFVTYYGSKSTFRIYGVLCAVVLAIFIFINFYRKDTGFVSDLPASEDPHQVAEESVHLAPHGVPSNPIPRVLSTSKLHDLAPNDNHSYGTTSYNGSKNLNIPGRNAKNPFLQDTDTSASGGQNAEADKKYDHGGNMTIHVQQPQSAHKQYDW